MLYYTLMLFIKSSKPLNHNYTMSYLLKTKNDLFCKRRID